MAYNLYDGPFTAIKAVLAGLAHLVEEAEKQPNAADLLRARLHDDMRPFTFQVHAATRFSGLIHARLTGNEAPAYEDDLTSFEKLHTRIDETRKVFEGVDKELVIKHGEECAPTAVPSVGMMDITGKAFVHVAMPNVFFHLSMTYAILRKEGVPLGKKDYIAAFASAPWPNM